MLRYLIVLCILLSNSLILLAQDVSGIHDIQPGAAPNEYNIKTTITGLQGVDIARIKYLIDNSHQYIQSPKNSLFSDINEKFIKFYIMAVPPSGELTIEFGVALNGSGEFMFPVEFQYSKDEIKKIVKLPQIGLSNGEAIALVEETPEPEPVVEETPEPEPVVEDTPEPEPVVEETPEPEPVVEETPEPEPVVEETPEPEPVVEETPEPEPVVEETPEPEPVVKETPEPEPVVKETPEPEPVVEETPPNSLERIVKEEPEDNGSPESLVSTQKYTVQLLSLANFSQSRLAIFSKQHNIPLSELKKKQVGALIKITYGEANSIKAAAEIKNKLVKNNGIIDAFVVPLN